MIKYFLYSKQKPTEGKAIFKTWDEAFNKARILVKQYPDEVFIIEEIKSCLTEISYKNESFKLKTKL